ncbi:hypothetical protein AB0G15_05935 [Streptosporangium sp. NPDC023825]|uniref:hypothetical protein n=1 Tax=Streptosporangium sp. NPDC023825 TaxID=3154909 RepID=UPI003416A620
MITVANATIFAIEKHEGQLDNFGVPYIDSLMRVREALYEHGDMAQVAGVLSGILRITDTSVADLEKLGVPTVVIDAIVSVTPKPSEEYFTYIRRAFAHSMGRLVMLAIVNDRLAAIERMNNDGTLTKEERDGEVEFLRGRYIRAREFLEAVKISA